MRHPWVNTLLLVFVAVALVSGWFGLTNGDPDLSWVLWVHAAAAYAIVALSGWKGAVIVRSVRRHRVIDTPRLNFLAMAVLFVIVLATGIIWAKAGRIVIEGYSLLTIHQLLAVAVTFMLAWHVVARRVVFRVRPARDRRAFLRLAAAGVGGVVLWQMSGGLSRVLNLPGADRRFTGSYETGSFTGRFPTVSWIADDPDPVDIETWRLAVDGLVDRPMSFSLADLESLAAGDLTATIDCTGGWYSTQEWSGIPIARLLAEARPLDGAGSITVESVTGYSRRFSMAEAGRSLLALAVSGRPLTHGHGAPVRIVVPDHRGFDWVKWVRRITVNEHGDIWQPPLPLQ